MISVYFTQIQFLSLLMRNDEDLFFFIFRETGRQHPGNTCARTMSSRDRSCISYTTSANRTHPRRCSNETPAAATTDCKKKKSENHEPPKTRKTFYIGNCFVQERVKYNIHFFYFLSQYQHSRLCAIALCILDFLMIIESLKKKYMESRQYRPSMKFLESNVFSNMCLSIHGGVPNVTHYPWNLGSYHTVNSLPSPTPFFTGIPGPNSAAPSVQGPIVLALTPLYRALHTSGIWWLRLETFSNLFSLGPLSY